MNCRNWPKAQLLCRARPDFRTVVRERMCVKFSSAIARFVWPRGHPGFLNKLLCNAVVGVLLKAALFARQFAQVAFGRERAALLQPSTQSCEPAALALDTPPAVSLAIAICGKIGDAQVNPKHAVNRLLVR